MIKIQCSILEQVRHDPFLYGQQLASFGKLTKGGSYGMFAFWKDISLNVHQGTFDLNEGLLELNRAFIRYESNTKNLAKQDFLQTAFLNYHREFKRRGFEIADSKHRISWQITSSGILTGLTPIVVKNKSAFYAYYFLENANNWQTELRFPLMQTYINENSKRIDLSELKVGVYSLSSNNFIFKQYNNKELQISLDETIDIFEKVEKGFNKYKSAPKK